MEIKHKDYRCGSNYALPKLIVDNGLENLWRMENPDSSEFSYYDRSSGTRFRIDRVYTDMKMLAIPRLITKWHPLLIIIRLFLLTDFPQKHKLEKINGTLIGLILFHVSPISPKLKEFGFLIKAQKDTILQQVTGDNTPSRKSFF